MLSEGRRAHVGAIRQVVPFQRFDEVLLEPGDRFRNLLAGGPGGDEVSELRAVRAGQQADRDFLLNQRRQSGNECWLAQQLDEADEGIEQDSIEHFEGDGAIGLLSTRPGFIHLGSDLQDRTGVECEHHAKKRFAGTRSRDM